MDLLNTDTAVKNASTFEPGKVLALVTTFVGGAVGGPSLGPLFVGGGLLAWGLQTGLDFAVTGRICPVPGFRKQPVEIFLLLVDMMGDASGGGDDYDMKPLVEEVDWRIGYDSRPGLDLPVQGRLILEPHRSTIDVPVIRPVPVQRLAQEIYPELDDPFAIDDRHPMELPIVQGMATVERRAVERQGSNALVPQPISTLKVRDRAWLLEELKRDCPEFIRLLKAPPIRCVGQQRTGKTTLVKLLCLCRTIILPNHQVIAATPHYKEGEGYPDCFRIAGIKGRVRDPAAIAKEWAAMARRIYQCGSPGQSFTNIWDEFGLYAAYVEEQELLGVVTSSLRETSKFGEYPIFIVHGETAIFLPGVKGLVTPFLDATTRVETIGAPTEDAEGLPEIMPTGRFKIRWTDGSRSSGEIPKWLTEDLLLSIIDGQQHTNIEPSAIMSSPSIIDLDPWEGPAITESDHWEPADANPTPPRPPIALPQVSING